MTTVPNDNAVRCTMPSCKTSHGSRPNTERTIIAIDQP